MTARIFIQVREQYKLIVTLLSLGQIQVLIGGVDRASLSVRRVLDLDVVIVFLAEILLILVIDYL